MDTVARKIPLRSRRYAAAINSQRSDNSLHWPRSDHSSVDGIRHRPSCNENQLGTSILSLGAYHLNDQHHRAVTSDAPLGIAAPTQLRGLLVLGTAICVFGNRTTDFVPNFIIKKHVPGAF